LPRASFYPDTQGRQGGTGSHRRKRLHRASASGLCGNWVTPLEIVKKSIDLLDAVMVHSGEPLLEASASLVERFGPEHEAAQEQERSADRAGQQDPTNSRDNEQDPDLRRHALDPADCLFVFVIDVNWL